MALSNRDQAKIREYLLGLLSEEEQEKIEERLMVEDDFFEELEISKGELIEEYCGGELSQNEHQWFERHYLATPEGKQRHNFALALNCIAQPVASLAPDLPNPAPSPPTPGPPPPTLLQQLYSLVNRQRWAVATPAALVLMVGVAVLIYSSRKPSYDDVVLVNNVAERSPTGNPYHQITLSPDAAGLSISLKLPEPATPGVRYRVEFDNRTDVQNITPTLQENNFILVEIPAKRLPAGLYAFRLYEIKADGTEQRVPGEYKFQITN